MTATRPERVVALAAGGVLALLFVVMSAWSVAGWTLGSAHRTQHRVIPGPVDQLQIDGDHGDVVVQAASGRDVTVDSEAHGAFGVPKVSIDTSGSRIRVHGGCDGFWHDRCSTKIVVHVPPDTPVAVSSTSGDVSAFGLSGPVSLDTSSGDVGASDLAGPVSLHTSSGDIAAHALAGTAALESSSGDVVAEGLRSATVHARTGSGDVALLFSGAPDAVDAETGSGDVALLVPGSGPYRVDAVTSSGDREIGVRTDPRASRSLRARSGSGDVSVLRGGSTGR